MKTEFIIGGRGTGKTTELIRQSIETGAHIVVSSHMRADQVKYQANRYGYDNLPKVLVYDRNFGTRDYKQYDWLKLKTEGILVDDIDDVLSVVFHDVPIEATTMSDDAMEFTARKPIVNCKDCGYYHVKPKYAFCDRPCEDPVCRLPDDFCSRGVRRKER